MSALIVLDLPATSLATAATITSSWAASSSSSSPESPRRASLLTWATSERSIHCPGAEPGLSSATAPGL